MNAGRTPDDHYLSAAIGAVEMLKTGRTTAYDLFMSLLFPGPEDMEAVVRAYSDVGLRVVLAPAVGEVGAIEPGRQADLALLRANSTYLSPRSDVLGSLVYVETGASVDTVLVGGRVLLRGGRVLTVDEDTLRARAQAAADGLRNAERGGLRARRRPRAVPRRCVPRGGGRAVPGESLRRCRRVIQLEGVTKTFRPRHGDPVRALEDVSLAVNENEFVSLVGPSGCGKSTLLRLVAGLVAPTTGMVRVRGREVREPYPDVGPSSTLRCRSSSSSVNAGPSPLMLGLSRMWRPAVLGDD